VNAISPGAIHIGAYDVVGEQGTAEPFAARPAHNPAGRIGRMSDVRVRDLHRAGHFLIGSPPVAGGEPLV
jgi:hypothetical protein